MTDTQAVPLPYLRDQSCPFDPAQEIHRLRAEEPIVRLDLPSEVAVWFVTRYADARAVLGDPRFSNAKTPTWLLRLPMVKGSAEAAPQEPGSFIGYDPPEHTRYRRLLTGEFTGRRIARLRPRIEQIVADHLDAMEQAGPPVDLVQAFAFPIPALVICELLGVPYEDREEFRTRAEIIVDGTQQRDRAITALRELSAYLAALVEKERQQPTDGMLGMLIREHGDELSDAELTGIGRLLLFAGHETTANMLALGTLLLLHHPDQVERLRTDPDVAVPAVEELMRYLSIAQTSTIRTATEDVVLGDHEIKAGDYVMVSLLSANRDEELYDEPGRFDITRPPRAHIAFGHGIHHCLGAPLARMEMQVAFPALFRRFPTLRLAAPMEDLRFRTVTIVYGVAEVPVAW